MGDVADNARSAIEDLIKELETERGVLDKQRTLNEKLISRLTAIEEEKAGLIKDNERLLKENKELKLQMDAAKQDAAKADDSEVKEDATLEVVTKDTKTIGSQQQSPKIVGIKATDIASDTAVVGMEMEIVKGDIGEVKAELDFPDNEPIDSKPMDERKRFFIKILMIIRFTFRGYFGLKFANRWGHWVDNYLCKELIDYGYWIDYQSGNHTLEGKASVRCAAISSDGCYLFVGYENNSIIKWNLLTLEKMEDWMAHDDWVQCLIFRCGLLISGSGDATVKVWNGFTNELIHTLKGHTKSVYSIDLNRNGNEIISGSYDHSMRVWSVNTGECLRKITVHSDAVRSALFIDEVILTGSQDKTMKIVNPGTGKEIRSITEGINYEVFAVCINSNQSIIACLLFENRFIICTWPEMKIIRTIVARPVYGNFHPINPDILAVTNSHSKNIEIYNVKTGDCIRVLKGHTKMVNDVCYTPDGRRIISASYDHTTRVWDVSDI